MKKSPPHKALNKDNIVADIKLTLTHPKYKERILVIVEGIYDEKLYLKFFDNNDTGIKSTTGHRYYEHILEQLNDSYSSRFIILKDADFDHLNKKCYNKYPNLFLTDTHDIETMMINDAVVDSICSHYLDDKIIPNLFNDICDHLKPLSYIKWYNVNNKLCINTHLSIPSCYSCTSISIPEWLNIIYDIPVNKEKYTITELEIKEYIESNSLHKSQESLLINGHDLCDSIHVWLKTEKKSCNNVNKKKIFDYISTIYTINDFMKTDMYKNICCWGKKNHRRLFY